MKRSILVFKKIHDDNETMTVDLMINSPAIKNLLTLSTAATNLIMSFTKTTVYGYRQWITLQNNEIKKGNIQRKFLPTERKYLAEVKKNT